MELRHLRYFVAVAEELHFSLAAQKLNIAQPPLSQQIQQLENELGVRLFLRTKRQVKLTYAGKVFLDNALKILNDLERACEATQRAHRGELGKIIVAFTGTATYDILPNLIQLYQARYPLVDLTVFQLVTTAQVEALLTGEIDVGILCAPLEIAELNVGVIRYEPFVVALPADHPLAEKTGGIEAGELAAELFIMTPRKLGPAYYDVIINICHNAGFSPNVVQESGELGTILALVAAKMGISLVPHSLQNIHMEGVVYRQLKNPFPKLQTALAWRKSENSPVVHTFLELATRCFPVLKD